MPHEKLIDYHLSLGLVEKKNLTTSLNLLKLLNLYKIKKSVNILKDLLKPNNTAVTSYVLNLQTYHKY